MHKRRTRGQQIAIRSFTYGVMTLFSVLGVLICLGWAMGFRIDFNDGKLTQVALLQFSSFPTGATVSVNGQTLSTRTATRANVQAGETAVTMSRDGYRSWSKTVNMVPSGVVWLNYVRLIPNSIVTDTTKDFAAIAEMHESPDKRRILLRHSDNNRYKDGVAAIEQSFEAYIAMPFTMTLADVSDPKNVKFSELTIPSDKIMLPTNEDQTEKFEIVEWDQNSRFILVKHTIDEMVEYLRLDRSNDGEVKNLTRDFGMSIASPHFSGASGNVFFALTGTDLRKFDYGNNTASAPLANNIQSFELYDNNRLVLISSETKDDKTTQSVSIYDDGRITVAQTYLDHKPTLAVLARFHNVDYLAIARGDKTTIYPKPLDRYNELQPIKFSNPNGVANWLDVSPSGQFILVGCGDKLTSLDIDTMKNYSFEIKDTKTALQWLDGSHIVSTSDNRVSFIEFDGQNRESIVSAYSRVTLSRDSKYLFSISTTTGGVALQRSRLVID